MASKEEIKKYFEKKVAEWTDEECDELDRIHTMSSRVLRAAMQKFEKACDIAKRLQEELDMLKDGLSTGKFKGYAIKCPHCGVEYNIDFKDLNYNKPITCMDCGKEYIQNQNIYGLVQRGGENES